MSSEKIGKHKGALRTLMHEKKELSRLLQIVNSQMKRHMQALEEEGIDSEKFMNQMSDAEQKKQQKQQEQRKRSQSNHQNKRSQNSPRNTSNNSRTNNDSGSSGNSQDRDFNPL